MTVLITGSTGGFGRLFSKWSEHHIDEEVILTGRAPLSIKGYIPCNLEHPKELYSLICQVQPRIIFHLAGSFANNYEHDYVINTQSAKSIFDILLEQELSSRVVLIGSAAEYGVIQPQENPINEDHVLRPVSVYGMTKACQTQLAYYYAHNHNTDVVVARVFNLMMSGLSPRLFVGRVENMINQIKKGEIDMIELGNLDSVRDYVRGDEAIQQINLIAKHGQSGEVYNVGSGKPKQMRDILDRMLREAGLTWSVVRIKERGEIRTGYDVPAIYADMNKTNNLLLKAK